MHVFQFLQLCFLKSRCTILQFHSNSIWWSILINFLVTVTFYTNWNDNYSFEKMSWYMISLVWINIWVLVTQVIFTQFNSIFETYKSEASHWFRLFQTRIWRLLRNYSFKIAYVTYYNCTLNINLIFQCFKFLPGFVTVSLTCVFHWSLWHELFKSIKNLVHRPLLFIYILYLNIHICTPSVCCWYTSI